MELALSEIRGGLAAYRTRVPGTNSASTSVYDDLRGRITRLELLPDTTLARADLAEHYNVSQTPVRDALQRLEQDGLVRIYPQSRTVVSRIDLHQLNEAHFLRVAVECEVARRLAENPGAPGLARARSIVSMQEAISGSLDQMDLFNELDEAFHLTLMETAGQGALYHLLKARAGHLARARRLDLPRKGKIRDVLTAHKAILDGIATGSPDEAAAAIRRHLSGTVSRIDTLRREHPAYFED